MLQRMMLWGIRSYIKGPARSWLYTTLGLMGFRLVRKVAGRQPVVETVSVAPGQTVLVEHLGISHKKQIKQIKRRRRALRRRIDAES